MGRRRTLAAISGAVARCTIRSGDHCPRRIRRARLVARRGTDRHSARAAGGTWAGHRECTGRAARTGATGYHGRARSARGRRVRTARTLHRHCGGGRMVRRGRGGGGGGGVSPAGCLGGGGGGGGGWVRLPSPRASSSGSGGLFS